jgi:hypothetical protein
MPFFIRWLMQNNKSPAPVHEGHAGTASVGQVFWLPDRSTGRAFPSKPDSGFLGGVRHRLQRRVRNGFAPFSLEAPYGAPK